MRAHLLIATGVFAASAAQAREAVLVRQDFLPFLRAQAEEAPEALAQVKAAEAMVQANSVENPPPELLRRIARLRSSAEGEKAFRPVRELVSVGEPALLALSEILLSGKGSARRDAASAIGAVGSRRGTLALVQVLHGGPPEARLASVRALVRIADARSIPFLVSLHKKAKARYDAMQAGALGSAEVKIALIEEELPTLVSECDKAIKAIERANLPPGKKKLEDALDALAKELSKATGASYADDFRVTAAAAERVLRKVEKLAAANPESRRARKLVEDARRVVMSDGAQVLCNEEGEPGLADLRGFGIEAVAWAERSGFRIAVANFGEPRRVRAKVGFFSGKRGTDRELIETASAEVDLARMEAALVNFDGVPKPPPKPKGRWVADEPSCVVTTVADGKDLTAALIPQGRSDYAVTWRSSEHVVRGDSFSVAFDLDKTMIVHVQKHLASRRANEVECRVEGERGVREAKHGWFVHARDFTFHVKLKRATRPDVLDMRDVFTRLSDGRSTGCRVAPGPRVLVLAPETELKTVDVEIPAANRRRSWPKRERLGSFSPASMEPRRVSSRRLRRLLRRLESDSEQVRTDAAYELAGADSEAAVAALIARLEDKYEADKVKRAALSALRRIGEKAGDATPACARVLESASPELKRAALWALATFADARAADAAAAELWDGDKQVRRLAACVLGKTSADKAVDPLAYALDDDDEHVRQHAAVGLRKLGVEVRELGGHIYFLPEIPRGKRDAAARKADAELVEAFADADWQVRRAALEEATGRDSATVLPRLAKAASDPRPRVRLYAVRALASLGAGSALAVVEARLDDADTQVRRTAAALLAENGSPALKDAWMRVRNSKDYFVRATAAEALGKLGAVEAAADLREAISHPNREIRFRAITALGRMRDAEAAPLLAAAMKGKGSREKRLLADALTAIGAPSVGPALELLDNAHSDVQKLAAETIVAIGEPARGPLVEALQSGRITEDEAYMALAKLGGEGTAELLLRLIRKPGRGSIQNGIEEALTVLGEAAVPALREFVEKGTARQRIIAAGVLAGRGDRSAMKAVTDALSDKDWDVKAHAAGVLRDVGTAEELPALLEATKARDCPQSVFWALKRLAKDEKSIKTLESRLLTHKGAEVARALEKITGKKYRYADDQGLVHDPEARTREPQTAVEAGLVGGKRRKRFDFETGEAPGWTGGKVVKRPARGRYSLEVAPPPVTADRRAAEVRLVSPPIGHVVGEDSWLSLRLNAPPRTQFGVCIVTERGNYHQIALIMKGGWAGFACPLAGMGWSRRRCRPGETVDRIEIRAFQRQVRDVPLYVDDIIIAGGDKKAATKEEARDEF